MFRDRLRPRHRSFSALSVVTPFFLRVISSRVYDLGSRAGTGVIFHRFVRAAPPPRTSRESLPALLNAVPRRFSALLASNDGGARENTRERKEKREREEGDRGRDRAR